MPLPQKHVLRIIVLTPRVSIFLHGNNIHLICRTWNHKDNKCPYILRKSLKVSIISIL